MNRANVKDLRLALEAAHRLAKSGIWFVCVPVADEADFNAVTIQATDRLEKMAQEAEQASA